MTEPTHEVAGEQAINTEVKVQHGSNKLAYKTKLSFTDVNRKHETVTSVQPPQITQVGMLQFLLEDRLISFPLINVFRMETEQLDVIEPSKIIVSSK